MEAPHCRGVFCDQAATHSGAKTFQTMAGEVEIARATTTAIWGKIVSAATTISFFLMIGISHMEMVNWPCKSVTLVSEGLFTSPKNLTQYDSAGKALSKPAGYTHEAIKI